MEKIAGNAEHCFTRLVAERPLEIAEIVKFTGLHPTTVPGWIAAKRMPEGENLLRLRYFLEARGCEVSELKDIDFEVAELGRLIAFRIITFEEAAKIADYPNGHSLMRVLLGRSGVYAFRLKRIKEFADRKRGELAEKISAVNSGVAMPTVPTVVEPAVTDPSTADKMALDAFPPLVQALLPLARHLVSPQANKELRFAVRRAFSSRHELHQLSDLINALLSEETLSRYLQHQQKHGSR